MSNFQLNPTVAAKELMRSRNPESMTLDELKEFKKNCDAVLSEIWKLIGTCKLSSAPERANIRARRFEMEMFIARIVDLINSHQASISLSQTCPPVESHRPYFTL
jgi:hypothetical protein